MAIQFEVTTHPIVACARTVLADAAELLEGEGFSRRDGARYGVPEAVSEAAGSHARDVRVLAERALMVAGIDVWWSDLICRDGDEAAAHIRAVDVNPLELYGPEWPAVLGLLRAVSLASAYQVGQVATQVGTSEWELFDNLAVVALELGRGRLFQAVSDDVQFSAPHHITSPAGVTRRLRGMRGFELVGAAYVLADVLSPATADACCRPVHRVFFT